MCYSATQASKHSRMDRSRLNIGAYHLQPYAHSEQHVKDVADCGIDFMLCIRGDRTLLDLFRKYNVGAIVSDIVPGWWGGDGDNAGTLKDKNPLSAYDAAAEKFQDHPAIWGIDIGDEPSALDFPHYGKIYEKVSMLFPHQFPYLNLYPNYASVAENNAAQTVNQLGTKTYEEHIASYCKNVPANYICYDFYLYSINVHQAYENLRVVSNACKETGRSMWIVLQVNSNKKEQWITENELRFQAYTAMAFGAENIIWACYTAGWWHNQVLDDNGEKTQQYDKLRTVNSEIHHLGKNYMKYRRVATDFVGFKSTEWLKDVKQQPVESFTNGLFSALRATDNAPLVVGSMVSRKHGGKEALFICAADDPYDRKPIHHTITFKTDGRKLKATGGRGELTLQRNENGYYTIDIMSNEGVLIEASK